MVKVAILGLGSRGATTYGDYLITLNDVKIEDITYMLSEKDFVNGSAILKKGKKTYHKLEI